MAVVKLFLLFAVFRVVQGQACNLQKVRNTITANYINLFNNLATPELFKERGLRYVESWVNETNNDPTEFEKGIFYTLYYSLSEDKQDTYYTLIDNVQKTITPGELGVAKSKYEQACAAVLQPLYANAVAVAKKNRKNPNFACLVDKAIAPFFNKANAKKINNKFKKTTPPKIYKAYKQQLKQITKLLTL